MASSFSTDLKLELMATGENSGTWGTKTNTNLDLVQQAIVGFEAIAITSTNTTLLMTDAQISTARNAVIKFTGAITANCTVFVASGIEKTYTIDNATTGAFTLALNQVGGSSVIWGTTDKKIKQVYLDGTNANTIDLSTLGGQISTSTALADFVVGPNELDTASVTSVKIASFAVTSGALDTASVTSVKIASFAVTSGALDTASVTSVKIASAAVGPTQLQNTSVTAGSFTAASITVDAQGRITAASSGSAGAGMGIPTLMSAGPSSGTYTAGPTANRIGVYMYAGGGGGGTGYKNPSRVGGNGGGGFYNKPIAQPFSQPFAVGAGGNSTELGAGNAGGNTTMANVGTVNAGSGSPGTACGAAGNQPGSNLTIPISFRTGGPIRSSTVSGFGAAGQGNPCGGSVPANPGAIIVFENTGT